MRLRGLAHGLLALAWLVAAAPSQGEALMDAHEVAERLGLSKKQVERVKKGEVVVAELDAASDKDLSLAIVALVDADLDRVFEVVDGGRLAELSEVTISRGPIDPAKPSLAAMTLDDETLAKLAADPGDLFYMSEAETERVAAAGKEGKAAALDAYRAVLAERARAYWEKGLDGVVPYAGDGRSPKEDLEHANAALEKASSNEELLAVLRAIPAQRKGPEKHQLFWAVQKGRDQAAPVLIHRIEHRQADGQIYVERRFYSGYDYDSLQLATVVLPTLTAGKTVAFYTNHTFTSQVAGFGGSAKRSIGRKLMQKELVAEMERARKAAAAR